MIKKTLLAFFIIFIAYTIILTYIVDPNRYISEHQWQDNQIKTQNYLFSDTDSTSSIIVGSSLSERLYMNQLPHFQNLGLLGLGAVDGLYCIMQKGVYPQYIFIETNHIDRPQNEELKTSLGNPLMTPLRKHIISLRDGKQPMSFIALPYGQKAVAYGIYLMQTGLHTIVRSTESQDSTQHIDILAKVLPQAIEYHSKVPVNLQAEASNLKQFVNQVEQAGSQVLFFEMPVHPQLCGLDRSLAIRQQMYKTFPREKYTYIDIPNCSDYTTTDGDHLDAASASKYTEYFKDQIEKLGIEL